jgi:glycolate oxidase FAD binding subunit
LGGHPDPAARLLSAPSGIVAYHPEEMTITVRAGTSVEELHEATGAAGQRTALPERGGTVGGALAVGENDHRALGRGMLRTALLQVRYVSAEGRLVTSGGPTVKNVTGFDLPRLMVGSLGTLGVIAEVILRTNPAPPVQWWFRVEGADPSELHRHLLAPSAIVWDGTSAWVELEGHAGDVDAQHRVLAGLGEAVECDGLPALTGHRWSLTPAQAARLGPDAPQSTGRFLSLIGLGMVFAEHPQPYRALDPAAATITRRLKQNFDPTGRLNPGRSVPGMDTSRGI